MNQEIEQIIKEIYYQPHMNEAVIFGKKRLGEYIERRLMILDESHKQQRETGKGRQLGTSKKDCKEKGCSHCSP